MCKILVVSIYILSNKDQVQDKLKLQRWPDSVKSTYLKLKEMMPYLKVVIGGDFN